MPPKNKKSDETTTDETTPAPDAPAENTQETATTVAPAATVPITVAAPKRELRPDEEKRMKDLGLL